MAADGTTEHGLSRISHYPPHSYNGHSQVFQSVQAADGVLYFTNYGAVLTWDGERWDRIPIPGAGFLYGIAALGGKRFAVCGVNTIALMEPDGTGAWAVRSLVEDLPPEERENLGEIWDLQATPEGLYFFSRRRMFRWTPEGCRVWHFETEKMIYGFWSGSSVYVQNLDDGLYRLEEDALISVSKDPLFRNPGPRMISDWEGGRLLIATMRDGLRLFDGENLTPFAAEAEAYLSESVVNRGIRLADGRLALGTFHGGLAIIDESGHFQRLFSEEGGLPNNTITHLSEDREGGVWVSMGSGIARVEVDGIITRYDRSTGLPNVVVSGILRHKDRLFLASSDGLHRLRAGDPPKLPQWEPVPSTGGEVHAMVPHKEALFATTKGRVIRFDGNESEVVWDDFGLLRALHVMKKVDDHILVGGRIGLGLVYREDNQWKQAGPLPGLEDHVLSVTEDAEGNIWLGTVFSGVLRVRSEGTATSWMENAEIDRFGAESGLASVEHVTVRYENNRIMAFPPSGPQVFDEASGRFTALEETSSLPPPEGWAWDVKVESERHGTWGSVYPLDDAEEDFRLYFGGRSPGGDWRWVSPEIFEEIGGVLFLYLEKGEPDILWAGGWSGLLRWEVGEGLSDLKSETLQVGVRKISLPNGTTTGAADGISFSHHRGALVFQYSAPVYTPGVKVSYRTLLEGYDKAWSEWSDEAERSFTNLPGGTYRFRVEARTPSGLSAQANLAGITVLPPWYLSPFALAGYLAVAGLLVWGGARLRLAALRRENRRLEAIVGERTAALAENERELRKARDAADHANRQKSRFLANMSHELRTPLNAIMGYAHVLDRDPHLDERNRQRVGILNTSCNRLVHLINEILDLSKIEAGRLEVHEQPTDLAAGIRALLDSFGARAAQKGIALACDADPGFPDRVLTDLRKVEQILGNLVGNGLKFTEEGEVRVVLAKESGQIRLDVVDTGIGIPADEAEAVFDAFHQTGESPGKEAGTGLGLAISRRLAEAMGGSLDCASGPGEGTRFRLRLPLKAAADAKSAPERTSSRRIGYAGRPRTVLVIDDVAANRDVVDELLSPLGFSVETAASGGEALARIAAGGVDTVLLDVRMKPMGGAEVLRQLRALPGGAGLPVISYSASLIGFTRADALAMGCDDWLPKPFPPEDLFKKLGDLLQLDWQFAAAEAPSLPLAGKYRFTKRDLGTLRALAYRREPAGLKSALQAIRSREPESAATVDPLLDLVSRFRISEISEQLETLPVREEPT
jgi:signal transduction histidine kinase/CheY-like chemotaxis protein